MSKLALFADRLFARKVGADGFGNAYYEARRVTPIYGRKRRFVALAKGSSEATLVPAEWHCWLHHMTDAPPERPAYGWIKPHVPNQTGTPRAYRPQGHDYVQGGRTKQAGDYEAWTPGG